MEPAGKPTEALQQMPHSLVFLIQGSDINRLCVDGSFFRVFEQNFWVQYEVSLVAGVAHLSWTVNDADAKLLLYLHCVYILLWYHFYISMLSLHIELFS